MQLRINGRLYEVDETPSRLLLFVLREELGLTGTKFGCGAGICGACTVIVDGVATRSCITPLASVADKDIRTVEGLASYNNDGEVIALHPVQEAFLDHQVPQCSWCMSGQMMTAVAFLEKHPDADEAALVDAMSNNYCRCGCYVRIRRALLDAATRMRGVS